MSKLTTRTVSSIRFDGKSRKHFDGGGLYLYVTKTARTWRYAYRHLGREKTYTIGSTEAISLAEARRAHQEARSLVQRGVDPVAEHGRLRAEQAALAREKERAPTIGKVIDAWLERKRLQIASADRTESNLRHLRPEFCGVLVAELTPASIIAELQVIAERRSADMAHRVLSYLRAALDDVLDDGTGTGLIVTNPASSPLVLKRLPPRERTNHFSHLTEVDQLREVLLLIDRYRYGEQGNLQTRALMWLTPRLFTRPSELRTLKWSNVNFEKRRLEIDREATKSKRPFLVPLAKQCLAVFRELKAVKLSDYVFHSPMDSKKPLSDGALRPAMKRAGIDPKTIVPHGFRHTASTMLNERKFLVSGELVNVRPDAIETQLSHHNNKDKVRAVYNRAEYAYFGDGEHPFRRT